MRKQIEVNEQYFEVLTSRKEAAQLIQEIKDDLIWGEEDRGFYPDNSLYIEYTDGSSVYVSEGDPVKKLKKCP